MKKVLCFGMLAGSLFFFLGCGGGTGEATGTDEETEALYESEEYQQEMMDTSDGGE